MESELWFSFDGHGSTRVLLDVAGAVAQLFAYDAYGQAIGFNPADALTEFLFSGEQFDAKIGQQYLRARYYDPATGRFNRNDPFFGNLDDPQSLHNYLYCHADPVSYTDPSGEFIPILLLALGIGMIGTGFLYMAADNYNAAADSLAKPGFDFSEYNKYSATGGTYENVGRFLGTISFVLAMTPAMAPVYGGVGSGVAYFGGGTAAKVGIGAFSVGLIDKLLLDSFLWSSGVNSSAFSDYYDHPFWSLTDLLLGTITAGLANGWDDIAKSLKAFEKPAVISRSISEPIGFGITPRTLDNLSTRTWYHKELAKIRSRLDNALPLEEQAKQASALRNNIRDVARDLMSDRIKAEELITSFPNRSWDDIVATYTARGFSGDALWNEIIDASMRSNAKIDAFFGL